MSFAIDVNILLYASDTSSDRHVSANSFVKQCMRGPDLFYLAWPTVMSYLRMATHPSIFRRPLSPKEASENIDNMIRLPHVKLLSEDERFWEVYLEITGRVPTRGNLVPDAHLAAILRLHGVKRVYTRDKDFAKFEFLDAVDPTVV